MHILANKSFFNQVKTLRFLCVRASGDHHQGCWRDFGAGCGGVGLGFNPAHGGGGEPTSRRPRRAMWRAQHWRPHHVRQWHQSGGSAHRHLPEHHPGKTGRLERIADSLVVDVLNIILLPSVYFFIFMGFDNNTKNNNNTKDINNNVTTFIIVVGIVIIPIIRNFR